MARARRAETVFVGAHVILPECSLVHISLAEFPVLLGIVDAFEKAFSLLFLRNVEKELNHSCSVPVKMRFQVEDRAIAFLPDRFFTH